MESKIRKSEYFKKTSLPAQIPTITSEQKEMVDSMIKHIDELLAK